MADPTGYDRDYSFSGFQANAPATPLPGQQVDIQLDKVSASITTIVDAIRDVRRSDGKLRNGIVTAESLSPDLTLGVRPPSEWRAGVEYKAGDTVFADVGFYRARVDHVSTDFAANLAAGLWELFADMSQIIANAEIQPDQLVGSAAFGRSLLSLVDAAAARAAIGAVNRAGDEMTGHLIAPRQLGVKATADSNAHVWLYNPDGKARGLLYWDRNSGSVVLRVYTDDGNGNDIAAGTLVLRADGMITVNGSPIWTDANGTVTNAKVYTPASAGDPNAVKATKLSFLQAGADAVYRTVQDKLRDVVSVKDFGAVGDGVTDDTAAIQAALNSSASAIYVPHGRYRVTANLTRSGNTLLHGDGQNASVLVLEGSASFIYTGGDASNLWNTSQIYIEKLSFLVQGPSNKNVVDISYTGGAGSTVKTAVIRDVRIQGTGPSGAFGCAIRMKNATNAVVDTVTIHGDVDGAPLSSGRGISMEGDAVVVDGQVVGGAPCDITVVSTSIYKVQEAVHIEGWVEGVHINKCTFVQVSRGVTASAYPGARPYISMIDTHINSSRFGVTTLNYIQCDFSHNLIYAQDVADAGDTSYVGIRCEMTVPGIPLGLHITDNKFLGRVNTPKNAIIVVGTGDSFGKISGNFIRMFDTGIWLQSGASNMLVTDDNRFVDIANNEILDQGTGNIICGTSLDSGGSDVRHPSGYVHKFGTSEVTLDANGDGVIPLVPAFRNEFLSGTVCNGDPNVAGDAAFVVRQGDCTASAIAFSVRPNPGAIPVRVNWTANGR